MKLRPEVATAVEIRLVAAEVLLRMARRTLHADDLLRLLDGARKEIADAVQCVDGARAELKLLDHASLAVASVPLVKNDLKKGA